MTYTWGSRKCADGVERDNVWYFTIKAEGGHFFNTAEDHPTAPNVPGIQLTEGLCLYIKDLNEDADFTEYKITYWETAQWYEIWCTVDGFTPIGGHEYDIYVFLKTGADGATWPETEHYIWNFGDPWIYEAPPSVDSEYLNADQMNAITANGKKFNLLEHETTTIDADGLLTFKFKSDGNPFADAEGGQYGVSFTMMGELYINGEKKNIVAGSYTTQDWYIIMFQIENFDFVSGEKYEIIFTVDSNDPTGNYCRNSEGYFVILHEYIHS